MVIQASRSELLGRLAHEPRLALREVGALLGLEPTPADAPAESLELPTSVRPPELVWAKVTPGAAPGVASTTATATAPGLSPSLQTATAPGLIPTLQTPPSSSMVPDSATATMETPIPEAARLAPPAAPPLTPGRPVLRRRDPLAAPVALAPALPPGAAAAIEVPGHTPPLNPSPSGLTLAPAVNTTTSAPVFNPIQSKPQTARPVDPLVAQVQLVPTAPLAPALDRPMTEAPEAPLAAPIRADPQGAPAHTSPRVEGAGALSTRSPPVIPLALRHSTLKPEAIDSPQTVEPTGEPTNERIARAPVEAPESARLRPPLEVGEAPHPRAAAESPAPQSPLRLRPARPALPAPSHEPLGTSAPALTAPTMFPSATSLDAPRASLSGGKPAANLGPARRQAREPAPAPAPAAAPLDPLALEEALVAILRDGVRQHGVEGPW